MKLKCGNSKSVEMMETNTTNQDSNEGWFETAEDEVVSFQKQFIPLGQLSPEDLLVPHVKYSGEYLQLYEKLYMIYF